MRLDRKSFRPARIWRLSFVLVWLLIAQTRNQCQAQTNATTPSSISQETTKSNLNSNGHLRLRYSDVWHAQIPGLYDELEGDITPIKDQAHFNRLVLGLGQAEDSESIGSRSIGSRGPAAIRAAGQSEQISLVQFYMASCPDCQGFSPYFKRFARDISRRWRKLVNIYTVNCNDFLNIHLCQEQNPRLIVPMVRWYVFPSIQRDHLKARASRLNRTEANYESQFHYPEELLNIAHRQFIPKQRRDLISLRHATIRFIELTLDELSNDLQRAVSRVSGARLSSRPESARRLFYESLPVAWHQMLRLGVDQWDELDDEEKFVQDLDARLSRCLETLQLEAGDRTNRTSAQAGGEELRNFVVLERRRSFIGRTLVSDWSGSMCTRRLPVGGTGNRTAPPFILHRSIDLSQLTKVGLAGSLEPRSEPYLFAFNVTANSTRPIRSLRGLNMQLIAWNGTQAAALVRHRRAAQGVRPERVQQRALLQEYYSRSKMVQPIRYAAAMSSTRGRNPWSRSIRKRDLTSIGSEARPLEQAELENANWVPEFVHGGEELVRRTFNEHLARELGLQGDVSWREGDKQTTTLEWGEIKRAAPDKTSIIAATEDDLSLMFLTDYYRALDEIVHIDLLSKGAVDGYQLLASCCFLRDIERHFPFQGNALGAQKIGSKSVARHYVQLVGAAWLGVLRDRMRIISPDYTRDLDALCTMKLSELVGNGSSAPDKILATSKELEQAQLEVKRTYQLGLPSERHLKWKYCSGSAAYLRGHTCSLWILFHTLTVQNYLKSNSSEQRLAASSNYTDSEQPIEYKFQVDYWKAYKRACDARNPDGAYLSSVSSELYAGEAKFVLANIINFIRFYLPCTSCAAHFSCMVEHSPALSFQYEQPEEAVAESHLLWLWEAHNRVNERTRGTHSEDPLRPKHIFPSLGACPQCYLTAPQPNETFSSMRFNQRHLVRFLVARYRPTAILNNKINIEDLYRGP